MSDAYVEVRWLPVGDGGHVAVHTSRWWERCRAWREHRSPRRLLHAALAVSDGDSLHLVEMTPLWGQAAPARGIVTTGPVGARFLGRSRWFRYEIRCRPADRAGDSAFEPRCRIPVPRSTALAVPQILRDVPRHTWGRDVYGVGDMWTSNSVVSFLLQSIGIDATRIRPPDDGLAPGWRSGIIAARSRPANGAVISIRSRSRGR